jgi:hypothetical protein
MNAAEPQPPALTKIVDHLHEEEVERPAATLRLRQAVGEDLAGQLLRALAGDHRRAGLSPSQS